MPSAGSARGTTTRRRQAKVCADGEVWTSPVSTPGSWKRPVQLRGVRFAVQVATSFSTARCGEPVKVSRSALDQARVSLQAPQQPQRLPYGSLWPVLPVVSVCL